MARLVDTGDEAHAFAGTMRKHALEATGGRTYAEMGRFLDKNGKETNDEKLAAKDPKTGQPVENGARNIWVTETGLSTALNVAYFAERVSMWAIVMGFALVLTGIGFPGPDPEPADGILARPWRPHCVLSQPFSRRRVERAARDCLTIHRTSPNAARSRDRAAAFSPERAAPLDAR